MRTRLVLPFLAFLLSASAVLADSKPNVVVIFVDDMGWAQPGCYGGKLAPTPHMDSLAASGVRFTNGYSSGCICSPGRVGLMTGRYQQRSGHDANSTRAGRELDAKEVTIAQRMKEQGYATGIVGKWHLGDTEGYLPASRGFDFSLGTVGNLGEGEGPAFYRGKEHIDHIDGAPITSPVFAREACGFMEEHKEKPFFLCLSLNAVHTPLVATEASLAKFGELNKRVQAYAGLIADADDAVGTVMAKLRELKLEENTLVFLISDNGGASQEADMGGLRGRKWFVWEGGIRVSYIASWKGRIPAGQVIEEPVIQLDVLPTALAVAGAEMKPEWSLDGVNLLPLMEGGAKTLQREALYWRFGVQYAVRQGDWKLVKASRDMQPMLVNLKEDLGEKTDLSAQHPERVKALQSLWDKWNSQNQPPRWEDQRWNGDPDRKADKKERKGGKKKKTNR